MPYPPLNETRPGWQNLGPENEGEMPGVISTSGRYWREQRRFLLKNLRDFGFGKSSMESLIQDEMVKLCSKLASLPEVRNRNSCNITAHNKRENTVIPLT